MNETRTSQPTPEQLLELLDSQLTLARAKREGDTTPRRTAVLVGGMLVIVAGCAVALFVLQQMLSDLREPRPTANGETEEIATQRENY